MAKYILFFHILHMLSISYRVCTKEYKAAAFEHEPYFVIKSEPLTRDEALKVMRRNTAVYSEQARKAHNQGGDIIVFPEDGIYGMGHTRETIMPYLEPIPEVSNTTYVIPCTDTKPYTEILQELSCIARNNSIALVANMGDIQYCTKRDPNCPKDGKYQFNTDVIFDSDGTLIAKYHKQHLYYEEAFNTPPKCEFVTFITSFQGATDVDIENCSPQELADKALQKLYAEVRFGVFTCFDMLFKDPAIDLVQTYGVQNIVFPTAWFRGFPMLISIEFQQAWSRVNCVNLVAANLFYPIFEFTGSGIYDCGKAKTYVYNKEAIDQRLLFATLSANRKANGKEILDNNSKRYRRFVKMFTDELGIREKTEKQDNENKLRVFDALYKSPKTFKKQISGNIFTLTQLTSPASELSVCVEGLCCNFKYSLPKKNIFTETFATGTFTGYNPNGFYWEVCLLLKCASNEEASCGTVVMDSETIFQSFTISGNFSSTALVFPTALGSDISLLSKDEIEFMNNSISVEALEKPLLTAALVGRVYSKDTPHT